MRYPATRLNLLLPARPPQQQMATTVTVAAVAYFIYLVLAGVFASLSAMGGGVTPL